MNDLCTEMQQIEQRIRDARQRHDMRLVKRLTSELQHLRTRAAEFADSGGERPAAPADRGLVAPRRPLPTEPCPTAAPAAAASWLTTDIPLGPLTRAARSQPPAALRKDGDVRPPEAIDPPPAVHVVATSAPAAANDPPAGPVQPSPPPEPSSAELLDWATLQLQLPGELATHARKLFLGVGTPEYPGDGVELDDVRGFLRDMLRITISMRFSEGRNLGIQGLDEVEHELHSPTRTGSEREFPCEQYDALLDLISGNESARLRRRPASTEHRGLFLRCMYRLRAKVIHHVQPDMIVASVLAAEKEIRGGNKDSEAEKYHNSLVPKRSWISRADLRAQRFPHALRILRNATSHANPDWLLGQQFPSEQFRRGFSEILGRAILEWISAERWLLDVAVANYKTRNRHGTWYELDVPGSPVLFVSQDRVQMKHDGHDVLVIDRVERSPLFPYYQLGATGDHA